MTTVLGVDTCTGGWVGVEPEDGRFAGAHFEPRSSVLTKRISAENVIDVATPSKLVDRPNDPLTR